MKTIKTRLEWYMVDGAILNHTTRIYPSKGNLFGIQVQFGEEWWWLRDRYDTEQEANDALLIKKLSL
jgi:hypothetical protein